jgi:hypothetical protein
MMGMNNGDTSPTPPESGYTAGKSDEIQTSDLKTKVLIEAKRLVGQTRTLLSQLILQLKKRKSSATKIQTASEESASGLAFASEVDEWLKKVLERSERKSVGALKKTASTPKKVAKTVKKSAHKKSKRKS